MSEQPHNMQRASLNEPGTVYEPLPAPPRLLFWSIVIFFVLAVVGTTAGIVIFRSVLLPAQQARVIGIAPFMEVFLDRTDPDATLPTVVPPAGGMSPDDLLNSPLLTTPEVAATEAAAATEAISLAPTEPPTATPLPTDAPTATPTDIPPTDPPAQPEATPAQANIGGASVAFAAEPEVVDSRPRPPAEARMYGFRHMLQTWNNCGPANITMALSYFGWQDGQEAAASVLKPDREDKNVSPSEMVAFVNEYSGVRAATRMGGDMDLIKLLIANEFPVVIETGYAFEGEDWLGHYRTLVGYDDVQRVFYVYDSWLGSGAAGEGIAVSYADFDRDWQAFNRVFIVLYQQQDEGRVINLLGDLADPQLAAEHALSVAQQEARSDPQNEYTWFNMGTALVKLGRYEEAAVAFDRANQIGLHFRMAWYQFGQFEAYFNVGRYDDVLSIVNYNLNNGGVYVEETHYWQGRVYEARGEMEQAAASYNRALSRNPNFAAAQEALNRVRG